jgi:hypothetical protein
MAWKPFTGVMVVVNVAWLFSKFATFLDRYQPREPAVKVFLKSFIDKIFPGFDWSLKTVFIVSAG